MSRGGSLNGRRTASGCEVPFVLAGGSSSFTRFKQLSTRRHQRHQQPQVKMSPAAAVVTASSPSLVGVTSTAMGQTVNNNGAPLKEEKPYFYTPMAPSAFAVMDDAEDHPGRRKETGFLQPIKHLSGRVKFRII